MQKVLAYILGVLGVALLAAGGVAIVLGLWFRETDWVAPGVPALAIGIALIGGARYLLRRDATALVQGGSIQT